MEQVFLYVFCSLAVLGGVAMVVQRSAIHGAISLLFSLVSLAAVYALLEAHLLAALQIIIYAGAIMILIVYVIMLLQADSEDATRAFRKPGLLALPLLLLFALVFGKALLAVGPATANDVLIDGPIACAPGTSCEGVCDDRKDGDGDGLTDCRDPDCGRARTCYGTVEAVGATLLGPYVLPFEVSSILLLAGIVGAVLLSGRKPRELAAAPPPVETAILDPDTPRPGGEVQG